MQTRFLGFHELFHGTPRREQRTGSQRKNDASNAASGGWKTEARHSVLHASTRTCFSTIFRRKAFPADAERTHTGARMRQSIVLRLSSINESSTPSTSSFLRRASFSLERIVATVSSKLCRGTLNRDPTLFEVLSSVKSPFALGKRLRENRILRVQHERGSRTPPRILLTRGLACGRLHLIEL